MAPYPQGATIWCSGRLPTERPAESSSSSPTASRGLGQSAHRPSGLAAAPDGALYISNDSHGRIWRVTFQGDVATTGIVPAPSPRMDTTGSHPMLDHRGHPSECRRSGAGLGLVPPPGAAAAQVALGARVFHGQAVGGTCEGLHGSNARGTPLAPGLASGKLLWGDGSLARSRRQSPTAGRTPRTTGAQCLQRAAHNSPPLTPTQGPPMCGPWDTRRRDEQSESHWPGKQQDHREQSRITGSHGSVMSETTTAAELPVRMDRLAGKEG
jgi:hypothetical protein